MAENNYAADLAFLKDHTEIVELAGSGGAAVAVAPGYQGRIMTSTLAGGDGASFGWLNAEFIAAGGDDPTFNNYGGEDRFWLGPEAGQYGLWFAPGDPFDTAHWKTPPGFSRGAFEVTSRTPTSVVMAKCLEVTNTSGTTFSCAVERTVTVFDAAAAADLLATTVPDGAATVGFESANTLTNASDADWTRDNGLLSIWTLGQFKPLAHGKVIVPLVAGSESQLGPKATTDYFGEVGPDRCAVGDDCLLFTCDGEYRSKIGISPARAKSVIGSYDPHEGVLTIVQFNLPDNAADLPYVNSLWEIQDKPFAGDAINSYNDGEAEPGAGQLGPFYEIETSSPAAELATGQALTHIHRTFHFAGELDALNAIATGVLGVDLKNI